MATLSANWFNSSWNTNFSASKYQTASFNFSTRGITQRSTNSIGDC